MTNIEALQLAVSLHTRTIVGLVDAVVRADTVEQRNERLFMIRDAAVEFKSDVMLPILQEMKP